MASGRAEVARQLQTLFTLGTAGALTDGELLERFASRRGEAAEAAFAALVERHGPVVLRVCRDVLGNSADAEDAFQATFLVLVRRASTIRNRDSLASWLYGVALRVAGCDRSATARRRVHERKAAERTTTHVEGDEDDLGPVLHEEVGRLPEKYRAAVVLCYWEGLTHEQAADRLRWPVGTVRSRLSWARQRLRARLIRRGLAPAVALAVGEVATSAQAVPEALVERTVQGRLQLVGGQVLAGMVSTSAGVLAEGAIRTMMLARWKMTALVLLTVGLVAAGAGGLALQERNAEPPSGTTKKALTVDGLPAPKSEIDQKIDVLNDYLRELRVNDEYRQVRGQLFDTNMKLIETEALYKNRKAEISAREAGADPELLAEKRIKDALRKDPEIASLMKEMDQVQRRVDLANHRTRSREDPSLVQPSRQLEALKQDLRHLVARKREELASLGADDDTALHQLNGQIESLKARKVSYEKLLSQIQVSRRQPETDPEREASVRVDQAAFREKEAFVQKWIEQLTNDARAARPR